MRRTPFAILALLTLATPAAAQSLSGAPCPSTTIRHGQATVDCPGNWVLGSRAATTNQTSVVTVPAQAAPRIAAPVSRGQAIHLPDSFFSAANRGVGFDAAGTSIAFGGGGFSVGGGFGARPGFFGFSGAAVPPGGFRGGFVRGGFVRGGGRRGH